MKRKRSGLPSWLHRRQTGGDEVARSFVGECGMTTNMIARLGLCRELEVTKFPQSLLSCFQLQFVLTRVTLVVLTAFNGAQEAPI